MTIAVQPCVPTSLFRFFFAFALTAAFFFSLPVASKTPEDGLSAYLEGNYIEAERLLRPIAESGDPEAQYWLSQVCLASDSRHPKVREGLSWLERSASQGYALAMWSLGRVLEEGVLRDFDPYEAMYWYRAAARQESNEGEYYFLDINQTSPVSITLPELVLRLEEQVEQGDVDAMLQIAKIYDFRSDLNDPQQAVRWYNKAASEGSSYAAWTLAFLYCRGVYVGKDPSTADHWMSQVAFPKHCED